MTVDLEMILDDFNRTRRADRKLEAALLILRLEASERDSDAAAELRDHIRYRRRSAARLLVARGDLEGLRVMRGMGDLTDELLPELQSLAAVSRETEIWAWLYGGAGTEEVYRGADGSPAAPGASYGSEDSGPAAAGASDGSEESSPAVTGLTDGTGEGSLTVTAASEGSAEGTGPVDAAAALAKERQLLAERILRHTVRKLQIKLPGFAPLFTGLSFMTDSRVKFASISDMTVIYDPESVLEAFGRNAGTISRLLLHLIFHDLYLHPAGVEGKDARLWDIACDMFADRLTDDMALRGISRTREESVRLYLLTLKEKGIPSERRSAELLYKRLQYLDEKELRELEDVFCIDDHRFWPGGLLDGAPDEERGERITIYGNGMGFDSGGGGGHSAAVSDDDAYRRSEFLKKWLDYRRSFQLMPENADPDLVPGSEQTRFIFQEPEDNGFSYTDLLRRFMVYREEMDLDPDSFDYNLYWYSRDHYDGVVFMEPLEYKEMYSLDEIVIAIDTSGSCRGDIVQTFLRETYRIFTEQGNFFRKMHVYIIQCDAAVQEVREINSKEDFIDYMDRMTIKGFGGTDFRPVFGEIEDLRRRKQITNMRALLYFTDGQGVFPKDAPDYETAFIFLNKDQECRSLPSWARRLDLGLYIRN